MIHVFPDSVREVPIPKVTKIYKADIGIRSIKSALEFKFVDSAQEAKTAIGGIYADVCGYERPEQWKYFYAVIYMTVHFFTQQQIEAEFQDSNITAKWKPILIYGKGSRKAMLLSK